jgi:hypothetical protein
LKNKELRSAIFCAWDDRARSLAELKDLLRNITIVGLRFFSVKAVRHTAGDSFCGRLWKSGEFPASSYFKAAHRWCPERDRRALADDLSGTSNMQLEVLIGTQNQPAARVVPAGWRLRLGCLPFWVFQAGLSCCFTS